MATIIIAHSNLLNLFFFACFVLILCALVYKFNTHIVKRASSLKLELETCGAAVFKLLWRLGASFEFIRTFSKDITFCDAVALEF